MLTLRNWRYLSGLVRHKAAAPFSTNVNNEYDMVVVGGGIVGMATAREILMRNAGLRMVVLEKEPQLAMHQSGRNSGVIHAGIYYKPGSLKAKLCVDGMHLMYKYLEEKGIPYKKVGKLIVATTDVEVERLDELHRRGVANNVRDLQVLDAQDIVDVEPNCVGLKAIWSPHTGIVDYARVTRSYGEDFVSYGGKIFCDYKVVEIKENGDALYPLAVKSADGRQVRARYVLTCGGLQSDKLAVMSGCSAYPKIVPIRGEYLQLKPEKCDMVRTNIYPVPDPRLPFLGVHFTPRMDGSMWLGPNAVLSFSREGYSWGDINLSELYETLSSTGFQRLAIKYPLYALKEMARSAVPSLQVRELQKFVPSITVDDIEKGPAGVRGQAVDADGQLVDDFRFDSGDSERLLHCRNVPSPGATSSLAIARTIAEKVQCTFLRDVTRCVKNSAAV